MVMKQEMCVTRGADSIIEKCDELVRVLERSCRAIESDGLPSPGEISLALQLALDLRTGVSKGVVRVELAKHVIHAISFIVSQWLQNN